MSPRPRAPAGARWPRLGAGRMRQRARLHDYIPDLEMGRCGGARPRLAILLSGAPTAGPLERLVRGGRSSAAR
jgi:hypothetical protein